MERGRKMYVRIEQQKTEQKKVYEKDKKNSKR